MVHNESICWAAQRVEVHDRTDQERTEKKWGKKINVAGTHMVMAGRKEGQVRMKTQSGLIEGQ